MGSEKLLIKTNEAYSRIDRFLVNELTDLSRTRIKLLIEDGSITVDGKRVKPSNELKAGQEILVVVPEAASTEVVSRNIELEILYEDEDIIVINKPQGMVVHPACGHYDDTLVNALLHHCKDLSGINGELRPGIVHRIDKDTSGVLVAAKNDKAHAALAAQWKGHQIKRVYYALCSGVFAENAGMVDAPIARSANNRLKMAVMPESGRNAITHYRVLARFAQYTLIECTLETGRTHQIRVHMAYLGHPVVADPLYGRKKESLGHSGQILHAKILGFKHPTTGKYMEFESALPPYFESILTQLR